MLQVLSSMIESKFTFLPMQVEGTFVDAAEADETGFRIAPKPFNPIHMGTASHKFILALIDAKMFAIAHIDQAIVPSPPIRINHAVQGNLTPNYRLQRGFPAVRNQFGIHVAIPLEKSKDDGFAVRPASAFPFNTVRSKVGFIDFHFAAERRLRFTKMRDAFPNRQQIPIHGIPIQARQKSHL